MQFRVLFLIATALAGVDCIAIPSSHILHERRDSSPSSKWIKRAKVQPHAILPIRIGLAQSGLEKGYEHIMDISDPSSPNYGKHWTDEQITEKFAPSEETVDSVFKWLIAFGISKGRITISENRGWLAFDATTKESEDLFLAEFHEYEHKTTKEVSVACDEYHLPKSIQAHIDYVTPGIRLISMSRKVLTRRGFGVKPGKNNMTLARPPPIYVPPGSTGPQPLSVAQALPQPLTTCNQEITPACVKALYKVPVGSKSDSSNRMGILEYYDAYDQPDLDAFWATYYPMIPKGTKPKPNLIDGGQAPVAQVNAGAESILDFDLAYPLIWPQNTILYQIGLSSSFNSFLDAIDGSYCSYSAYGETGDDPNFDPIYPDITYKGKLMCGKFKPTNVISISYGGDEFQLPAYYQQRQCNEFMKLGLAGTTVLFASGDAGVSGDSGCIAGFIFSPGWPATCPYVTAVGATKMLPGKKVTDSEVAANEGPGSIFLPWSTGGGFSNVFPAPSYQAAALKTYFGSHKPPYLAYEGFGTVFNPAGISSNGGIFNRLGRGIPDVSANGDNITVIYKGQPALSAGTSASTPIFGAIINLINEERLAAKKSTVGFINPVLYANPGVLNDIKKGNNPGCGTDGFSAVSGWDPLTGLGTPNYPKMLKLFMGLP